MHATKLSDNLFRFSKKDESGEGTPTPTPINNYEDLANYLFEIWLAIEENNLTPPVSLTAFALSQGETDRFSLLIINQNQPICEFLPNLEPPRTSFTIFDFLDDLKTLLE